MACVANKPVLNGSNNMLVRGVALITLQRSRHCREVLANDRLWIAEHHRPSTTDLIGAGLAVVGALVIIGLTPKGPSQRAF
jgi:hypothetical protein